MSHVAWSRLKDISCIDFFSNGFGDGDYNGDNYRKDVVGKQTDYCSCCKGYSMYLTLQNEPFPRENLQPWIDFSNA